MLSGRSARSFERSRLRQVPEGHDLAPTPLAVLDSRRGAHSASDFTRRVLPFEPAASGNQPELLGLARSKLMPAPAAPMGYDESGWFQQAQATGGGYFPPKASAAEQAASTTVPLAPGATGTATFLGRMLGILGLLPLLSGDTPRDEKDEQCEHQYYRIDVPTCRAIRRARGPQAGARCQASATARYSACLRGDPLPPLDTWNN